MCILFYSFIFVVLKIEPSSLCMQGKSCTTEPHPLTLYFARLIFLQSKDFTCDTFSKASLWFSQLLKSGIEVKILSLIKSYYLLFFLKYYQIWSFKFTACYQLRNSIVIFRQMISLFLIVFLILEVLFYWSIQWLFCVFVFIHFN